MRNPRALLTAGVVIVAAVLAVVVLPQLGGDDADDRATPRVVRATLTLERARQPGSGDLELLVSSPGPQLNSPDLTGGAKRVSLRCLDAGGALVIRAAADWPLLEEPGFAPHIHQLASRERIDRVRSCRLTGPGIEFEGRVPGTPPLAR